MWTRAGPIGKRPWGFDITGGSGRTYSFFPLEEEGHLKPIGVTYVVAAPGEAGWTVFRVGESNNLAQRDWQAALSDVRQAHPKAKLLIRLNVSRSIREAEATDISAIARPSS